MRALTYEFGGNTIYSVTVDYTMLWDRSRTSPAAFPQIGSATEPPGERFTTALDSMQDILNSNSWDQETLKTLW